MLNRRSFLERSAILTAAAAFPSSARAEPTMSIVATTGMIADAAREIAGELGDVRALMGPGIDPHAYRQTRSDIAAMSRADVVFRHGLYLEAQMDGFFDTLATRVPLIAVAEAVAPERLISHDVYTDKMDPHIWMDPDLWAIAADRIRDALVNLMPAGSAAFEERAADFASDISAIGAYATEVLASVPEERRVLVSAHDAFNYFGRAYGFEVVGIQGISTESEAGLARVAELVDLLVERRIGAVFVESSVSDRNVRALIEGAASKGHEVRIGGELFSDAMGERGTYEGTYLGMIDHNVTTVSRALGGRAPERGRIGRLAS